MMLSKSLIVGLILGICKMENFFGYCNLCRPIIISTLVGLVLGDVRQGLIIGSALEMIFIGSFAVGAAVSPDYGSAGALCTAFAILSGGGTGIATALAVPIALLGGFILILGKLISSFFAQIIMKHIEKDDTDGVTRIFLFGGWFVTFGLYFIYGFLAVFAGSTAVEAMVNNIPKVVINGLSSAANLLPAMGFAMLLRMIISKKMAPFFFIGFMMAAYMNLPTIAVTLFAVMIVLIIINSEKNNNLEIKGGDENEF